MPAWYLLGLTTAALLGVGIAWQAPDRRTAEPNPPSAVGVAAAREAQRPSIAVLPYENPGAPPNREYLVDGLADEIIRSLGIVEGLDVRSRTSSFVFKGTRNAPKARWSMESVTKAAGALLLCVVTAGAQNPTTRVVGDIAAGKALFAGAAACATCHAIEGSGRKLGPDLRWIGIRRSDESLRRAVATHQSTPTLSAADIDHLVAYLRTLRSIPPSDPRERTREIPTASENVEFFNRPQREAEERSDALVEALEIPEGSTIADIGAGTGYFTWRLARRVGPTGKIIVVDIKQRMLDLAADTVKQHGLGNVDFVLGKETDPRLPPRSLDMVFIAHSYHEFADPETIMEAIRRSLKPSGRLVVVEYAKESKLAPAAPLHKMSFNEIREEIEPMGFELDRILDFLPVQHALIFTLR